MKKLFVLFGIIAAAYGARKLLGGKHEDVDEPYIAPYAPQPQA